jgi:hypothetical protein
LEATLNDEKAASSRAVNESNTLVEDIRSKLETDLQAAEEKINKMHEEVGLIKSSSEE